MAFVVADAFHEIGIATILLRQLVAVAKAHGIAVLTAVVLPENHRMTGVFADSGYPVKLRALDGRTHVELTTSLAHAEPWPSGGWAVKPHPRFPTVRLGSSRVVTVESSRPSAGIAPNDPRAFNRIGRSHRPVG